MVLTLIAVVAVIGLAAAFMGTVDQSGLVTIEPAKGTAGGRSAIAAQIVPTPTQFSYGSLVRACMDAAETAAVVVVDVQNRKVYFTDDGTVGTALDTAARGANYLAFLPDAGQTGRSITWTADAPNGTVPDAWMTGVVEAAKPRLSVESLVSRAIGYINPADQPEPPKQVIINQNTGEVVVSYSDRGASVAGVSLSSGNSGQLTLSEPTPSATASALIFEGGSTDIA